MIKLKTTNTDSDVIMMKDMKPYDIGVIVTFEYIGETVMRTASVEKFEVLCLSNPKPDMCWLSGYYHKVKLLPKGTEITFVVV